jgi:ABC-type transport system involved in cytochrome c biogenesis permease component
VKSTFTQISLLLRLYWKLEGQNKQVLSGVILYVVAIVLVSGYIFEAPAATEWLGLFWIILLFASVNTGVLSYLQESGARRWYYYQLTDATSVYVAKSIHIFTLILLVSAIAMGMMSLRFGLPMFQPLPVVAAVLLTSAGLAMLFAFMSGIASQVRNAATLTTIIGFPLVIGLSLLAGKIAAAGLMREITMSDLKWDIMMLLGMDLLIGGLGILLFAYIWRE